MTDIHLTEETATAFITRTGPHFIETRFKPDIPIDAKGMVENIRARRRMCDGEPHVMLTVVEGDRYFDPEVMRTNFYELSEDRAVIRAIALVLDGDLLPAIARLYFAYFPQTFRTGVFRTEQEAREWLAEEQAAVI
ncbi:MAG: hypothetical protein H6597_01870 [Flavobacteriales bacterium]|nr:hypothetical protein [Flavobacteriales bacterium]